MPEDEAPDEATPDDDQSRLTPEAIAYRSFSGSRRGISEAEVRDFLQEVAGELADAEDRERELRAKLDELEHRPPPKPRPLTEEEMLNQFGEETARVLRSAQEAAEDIRRHATEQAARTAQEAEDEAEGLRKAANNVMADRSREADIAAAVTQQEAEGRAQAKLRQAARDAAAEIEAARQRGREMVNEARVVRERILADLGRRRSQLEKEVGELESARERLLEAGRLVRGTLADAAEALVPFEVVAESAEPGDEDEGERDEGERDEGEHPAGLAPTLVVVDGGSADEPGEDEGEPTPSPDDEERAAGDAGAARADEDVPDEDEPDEDEPDDDERVEAEQDVEPDEDERDEVDQHDGGQADVDAVFARLRSARERRTPPPPADTEAAAPAPAAVLTEEPPATDVAVDEPEVSAPAPDVFPQPDPEIAALLAQRDAVLEPEAQDLVRRCKRAIQDEQNEVLDRLRRGRGRTEVAQLLLPSSVQVTTWSDVIEPNVDQVYGAGIESITGGETRRAPRRLVSGLAEAMITPLRDRLTSSLESAMTLDLEERVPELTARIGARYREWRAQELEARVVDVLAAAYTRGVFDAAPEDVVLRWIPAEVGRCPDADDNALEPTRRGEAFPTGQEFPPAHPGCRCLLAVVEEES